jgi:AbrB family looped-hinge helix DNA binding protein
MSGNSYQYDPTQMFKEWIQKSGKAQTEFMRNFASMMNPQSTQFDPLETLKDISNKSVEAQSNFMQNLGSMQSKGMDKMFNMAQMMPNFLSWGAYKTSVGSNGRISIPEAEREALGLKEGDLVQVVILPIEKKQTRR